MNNTWLAYNWLKLLAIAMVIGAVVISYQSLDVPFAFYQLLNWVVAGAALIAAKQADHHGRGFLMWVFIFVAVIFNPIQPFNLRADIWQLADLLVALLFGASIMLMKPGKK